MFLKAWIAVVARGARDDEGQSLVEYSLILFLISVIGLGLGTAVGLPIQQLYQDIIDNWPS
jgi:Flp pilus assembly pilin Flp